MVRRNRIIAGIAVAGLATIVLATGYITSYLRRRSEIHDIAQQTGVPIAQVESFYDLTGQGIGRFPNLAIKLSGTDADSSIARLLYTDLDLMEKLNYFERDLDESGRELRRGTIGIVSSQALNGDFVPAYHNFKYSFFDREGFNASKLLNIFVDRTLKDPRFDADDYLMWREQGYGALTMLAAKKYGLSLEDVSGISSHIGRRDFELLDMNQIPVGYALPHLKKGLTAWPIIELYCQEVVGGIPYYDRLGYLDIRIDPWQPELGSIFDDREIKQLWQAGISPSKAGNLVNVQKKPKEHVLELITTEPNK